MREALIFSSIPPPSEVSKRNRFPFTLTLSAPTTSDHVIDLYAQFSKSQPYRTPQPKYGNLLPQWQFTDTDGNTIQSITTTDTFIYNSTGGIIGVTGTAQFYYIDDLPTLTDEYVLLWATLQASGLSVSYDNEKIELAGYSNSLVAAAVPYVINDQPPAYLEITRNGSADIMSPKWMNVEFPYTIVIKGNLGDCEGPGDPIIFSYPSGNDIGNLYPISIGLTGLESNQVWNPDPSYFKKYDVDGFEIGGHTQGSVYSRVSGLNTAISAQVIVKYDPVIRDTPYAWVSNPDNKTLNKIYYFKTLPPYILSSVLVSPITSSTDIFTTPYLTSDGGDPMILTGYGGIFGIAVDKCYNVWTTDAELDALFKFDVQGSLLSSIYLKTNADILSLDSGLSAADAGITPAGIAFDKSENIWVTFFDAASVVKFDSSGNFITAASITAPSAGPYEDLYAKPPQIDTDLNNDVWVTFANNNNSSIVKFSSNGDLITAISVPIDSTPIDLIVDGTDNSFWVTNAYSHHLSGNVQKYNSDGSLISTWNLSEGYPSYITLDIEGKAWFNYGFYNVGCINSSSTAISSLVLSGGTLTLSALYFDPTIQIDDQAHEGIACDSKNRIWVINSIENKVYVLSGENIFNNPTNYISFPIYPDEKISWFNDTYGSEFYSASSTWIKSAQAFGDWTGFRWARKYGGLTSTSPITAVISGMSNLFNIKPLINDYDIRRFNESWDATSQIRSYALPDHINQNYNLFENLLGNMVGGLVSEKQQLGRTSYEKIANYVDRHADPDSSGIDQLYSLSDEIDMPIDNYQFDYPVEIKRLMDIISVDHQHLWGDRCKCVYNLNGAVKCKHCGHEHDSNRGDEFSYLNYTVTGGTPFIVKHGLATKYRLVIPPIKNTTTYPLSTQSSVSWLLSSEYLNYVFYDHISTYCNEQITGYINWDDTYTTLEESNSSIDIWYKDDGVIEEILNYMLHKGLDLEKD